MVLKDSERQQIAYNRLQRIEGYNGLSHKDKNTLVQIFTLGMLEMNELVNQEIVLDMKLQLSNLK